MLHKTLLKKSKAYNSWHKYKYHQLVHWLGFLVVAYLAFTKIDGSIQGLVPEIGLPITHAAGAAMLTLSPSTKSVSVNQTFVVNINLDTGGSPSEGVDIYSLHFDPNVLQVVDSDPNATGVQILPGSLMAITAFNAVDNTNGIIRFAQSANGGTSFTGSGILASITFQGLASGTSALTFDFTLNSTTDTDVAYHGVDQLATVNSGSYSVDMLDGQAPTVSITSPLNNAAIVAKTTVNIQASASDNVGVTKVEFYVNGTLTCTDTAAAYTCSWKVPAAKNRSYNLQTLAYDAAGNFQSSSVVRVTAK